MDKEIIQNIISFTILFVMLGLFIYEARKPYEESSDVFKRKNK